MQLFDLEPPFHLVAVVEGGGDLGNQLNVIDEHSSLCLAIRVGRRCKAKDVVAVLEELTSLYPAPTFIRSDNGPEFNCFAEAQGLRPGSTGLVRGQHHHQHGLHRAGLSLGERIR